jgi:hypothetical protein
LAKQLTKHGYYQARHTSGFWHHTFCPIMFSLIIDKFAIQYVSKDHVNHLINLLHHDCEVVSVDWEAVLYCGITCKWDYKNHACDMSMPGYIKATLDRFQNAPPKCLQHSRPHHHKPIQYGIKVQLTDTPDLLEQLPIAGIKHVQKIVGTLLYYACTMDNTLLVTLSSLTSRQSKATHLTNQDSTQLLNYCHTHPEATVCYWASDVLLKIHSDAGYLNESKASSCAIGHFYLGNHDNNPNFHNGAILNPTGILRHIASAASEAEYGALFVNCKEGTSMQKT